MSVFRVFFLKKPSQNHKQHIHNRALRYKNYRDIYSRAVRERSEQALQMSDPGQGWKPCSIQASSLAGSNPEGLPIKPEVCRNSLWNGSQVKGGALASTCWNKLRRPVRRPKGGRAEGGRRKANNAKKREAKKRLSWLRLGLPPRQAWILLTTHT